MYKFLEKKNQCFYLGKYSDFEYFLYEHELVKKKNGELLWESPCHLSRLNIDFFYKESDLYCGTGDDGFCRFDQKTGQLTYSNSSLAIRSTPEKSNYLIVQDDDSAMIYLYSEEDDAIKWKKDFYPGYLYQVSENFFYASKFMKNDILYKFSVETGELIHEINFKDLLNEPGKFGTTYLCEYEDKALFVRHGYTETERGNRIAHSYLIELDIYSNEILRIWGNKIINEAGEHSLIAQFQNMVFDQNLNKLIGVSSHYFYELDLNSDEIIVYDLSEDELNHSLRGFRGLADKQALLDNHLYISAYAQLPEYSGKELSAIAAIDLNQHKIVWSHIFTDIGLGTNKPMVTDSHLYTWDLNKDLHVFEKLQ